MKPRSRKIFFSILILAVILFLFVKGFVNPFLTSYESSDIDSDELRQRKVEAQAEYKGLFSAAAADSVVIYDNFVYKSKFPYVRYMYKTFYEIVIYKMKVNDHLSFKDLISLEQKSIDLSGGTVYTGYKERAGMEFSYSSEYDSIISHLYLTYSHELDKFNVIGDSIVNISLTANNISLRYQPEGIYDIVFLKPQKSSRKDVPININVTFLQRQSYIYFIVVYPRKDELNIDSGLLEELFGWKLMNRLSFLKS
jgi:hypothetical protein